ncbi:MAG TPA: hypothetical protein DDW55_04300 [Gammaproteobacteria bacterium]|nr:hypothetical protein [Gammaproteobacteria bacterium]
MKFILTTILAILLSACTTTPSATDGPGLYTIPVGSVIQLNQALTIPARQARTAVQYGNATQGTDKWDPYCEFLVNTLAKTQTTLPAGDYRVTKIQRAQIPYANTKPSGGQMVASADETTTWVAQSPSYSWLYKTILLLESNTYPDVRQLECGTVFNGYEARHITIKEFEILAGDVMTLKITGK